MMKSMLSFVSLFLWIGGMSLTDATATNLFRNSYLTFIGGQWMKLSPHKIRSTVLPMKICTVERTFPKASMSMAVAEDIDGAELLDVEEEVIDNYIWTPELDSKLLSELKRMKKLRWYKVAKLMGEGATARNCHDRWRELVWLEKISDFDEVPILPVVGKVSDGWDDEEVTKLVSTVDNNTHKEGSVDWNKVATAMGFEASVCEEKYNKLLAEEAAASEGETNQMHSLVENDDAQYSTE